MIIKLSAVMLLSQRIEGIVRSLTKSITYGDLCVIMEKMYGTKYHPHNKWVSVALYEVCKRDAAYDRPLSTVRVVNKWSGKPSDGFFSAARALGYQFQDEDTFISDNLDALNK